MGFLLDIIREKGWVNTPLSFSKKDSFPKYTGTKKELDNQMESNKSLFDNSQSIYDYIDFDNPIDNSANLDFLTQRKQWKALNDSLTTTRLKGNTPNTRLIGFDFETLAADVSRPHVINNNMAITELGITETIVKKTTSTSKSYSIAGGINEEQLKEYLKYFKTYKEEGLSAFKNKTEKNMVKSLMDRLSVYGQDNIDNVFQVERITNLGNVITINPLSATSGKGLKIDAIEKGLLHLSVLGGISEESWSNALGTANIIISESYSGTQKIFEDRFKTSDFKKQIFSKDSELSKRVSKFFNKNLPDSKPNTFIFGFNSNLFDLNIWHQRISNVLNKENTIDISTGIKAISHGQDAALAAKIAIKNGISTGIERSTSQEGLAIAEGISTGIAHNAGYDSKVANELIAKQDFYEGKSLSQLATDIKIPTSNNLNKDKKIFYALNSLEFDKNGLDYLTDASMLHTHGVQRGRYYYIDDVKEYENGKYGIKFISAVNENEEVIKIFDTIEDIRKTVYENFLVDNDAKKPSVITDEMKKLNDNISSADKARRNLESLYDTSSISYNAGKSEFEGGYDRLNKYYKAYQISSYEIGEVNPDIINKIINGEYDEQLINALRESFDIPKDKDVYKSLLRDFKYMYGKIHDESEIFNYIQESLDEKDLDIYQKTLAAKKIRNNIIQEIEKGVDNLEYQHIGIKDYTKAARRDLFDVDIYMNDSPVRINFETSKAVDSLTKNFYYKSENKSTIDIANSMVNSVSELYSRDIVDIDFLIDFYRTAGVNNQTAFNLIKNSLKNNGMPNDEIDKKTSEFVIRSANEIQPRKLSEMISSYIQNTYVRPILDTGYTYGIFVTEDGKFSHFLNDIKSKKYINFMQNKTEKLSGNISLSKALGSKYIDAKTKEIISVSNIFNRLEKQSLDNSTQKILSSVNVINTTLDKNKIKEELIKNLNHTEDTADEILRMLDTNGSYGLGTYKKDKKVKYITNFAYSGKNGEDAFVLVNQNEPENVSFAKTLEIMSDENLSFKEKINLIRDNGYSAVLPIKAVNRHEINPDEAIDIFEYIDIDGNKKHYSHNAITTGDAGYQKASQYHLSVWDNNSNDLSKLDVTLVDDATSVNQAYRRTRKTLFDDSALAVINDTSLTETEKNIKISKLFKKAEDKIISDMPGFTGYIAAPVNSKWTKTNIATKSDTLLSSQISIQPLELLVLQTAKEDYKRKELEIAKGIASNKRIDIPEILVKLSGISKDKKGTEDILNLMIDKAKRGEDISDQFNSFFYKHLFVPMNLEEGEYANNIEYSFMDYMKDSLNKGYYSSKKTQKTIGWLVENSSRMSQITKEKARTDKKIYLIDAMKFNQNAHMSSTIRPVSNQVQNDYHYVIENVSKEMNEVSEKLNLTFGYDYISIQEAQRRNAFKETYDNFETAITANVRQMDSTELIGRMHEIETKINADDEWFESIYKGVLSKYNGLSESQSKELMIEAFNIVKANSSNVYADRAISRTSFTNNQLFKSPEIKTIEINAIDESEFNFLLNDKKSGLQNILKTGNIKRGKKFKLSDGRQIIYSGPSGKINGDVKEFFISGKSHLIENTQGTQAVKVFFGVNEKATLNVPEFDMSSTFDRFRMLSTNIPKKDLEGLLNYYSEAIYDELLGKNVSIAGNLSINKHGSNDIIEGSYFNTMFYHLDKYSGDKQDAFSQLQQILNTGDPNGYRFGIYKGQYVYDDSQLGTSGLIQQVRNAREEIFKRAIDTNDKHQSLWKSIADEITYNEENNIFRAAIVRGIRTESTGGAMYMDPRMSLSYALKFHEQIEELNDENTNINNFDKLMGIKTEDGNVTFQQYIVNRIKEETLDDLNPDTSKTPINPFTGKKYKSADKTVQGLHFSSQYIDKPDKLKNSNMILDLKLEDIKLIPSGSNADELMRTGVFKMVNKKGNVYSDQLKSLAKGKNLDDVAALRIALPDGMYFNFKDENGKAKQLNHLLVPLYDITPFKGEIQYTDRIRNLNKALEVAKNFLVDNGLNKSQEDLDKAVEVLFKGYVADLNDQNKNSYIYQNLLRLPMKNSRMLHAESSIAPVVKAMSDDYYKWYNKAEDKHRKNILEAVKYGNIEYNIDFAEHTGRYTTIKDEKMYYDDVIELGREAFEEFGVDFKKAGQGLFYDIIKNDGKNYRPLIKEMEHGFFDEVNAKSIIDKRITNDEVIRAAQSMEEYNILLKRLKDKNNFEKAYKELYFDKFYGNVIFKDGSEISAAQREAREAAEKYFREVRDQMKILDSTFETVAERYLKKVGIFSTVGRWPTKDEGGLNTVITRLSKDLKRDDIRVTPALIERMHGDFDGDNLLNKLHLGKGGGFLTAATLKDKMLLSALTKSYEYQVFKPFTANEYDKESKQWKKVEYISRNNREVSKLIKDNIEKIDESLGKKVTLNDGTKITLGNVADYATDMVGGKINIAREKTMIDKFMNNKDRERVLTELGLENLKEVSVDEYSDEVVHKVFNVWNKQYGNMLENLGIIMASDKSRHDKSGIGSVSNVDYKINQVLLESLDNALASGDKEAKRKLNEIKTFLHLGATGFLPDTEQFAIDVKHVSQGATTSQIEKFKQGVDYLFSGDVKQGELLIRKAMQNKFKDSNAFEKGLSQLIEFSKDEKTKDLYRLKLSPSEKEDLISNLKRRKQIEKQYKYYIKNGMGPNTAFGASFQTIQELRTAYNMGYYHNGALQALAESQVYISTENGVPVLYRATQNMQGKNGQYIVNFEKINLDNLTKKAQWENATPIKGSAIEIQSMLQEKFGDYRAYSIAEVLGDTRKFKSYLRQKSVITNANKYANMYSRGNTKMAEKFLEDIKLNKEHYGKRTITAINNFKNATSEQQYIDFINKVKFIKSNTNYQSKDGKRIFKSNSGGIDDLLTDINKQIIELGKNANPTSTSVIFDNNLKKIASEFGMSQLQGQDFSNVQRAISNVFEGYEDTIIDIRKAQKDLENFKGIKDEADKILNSYKQNNRQYINELQSKMNLAITSDYDEIFGWNNGSLENMRVGFNTDSGLFGRRFSDLSNEDIKEILNYKGIGDEGTLFDYSLDATKSNLRKYLQDDKRVVTNVLQGLKEKDKINLTKQLNDKIKQNAETAQEGMNANGKKISGEQVKKTLSGAWDKTKDFAKTTPGKITMGLAALGLVSNLLSSGDNQSPLSPEMNHKESTGPINNDSNVASKAPSSNTGRKTIYTDSSSGLQFKMSAKSKNKVNQMQMARQLSVQTGGDTNVNVYDDRSQISSNWLERKFSELV